MEKKWNLQDIRPSEKRRSPSRAPSRVSMERAETPSESDAPRQPKQTSTTTTKGRRTGLVMALIIFFVIAAGGFALAALTAGAEVTVFPRFREPTINGVFEAKRQAAANELPYEVMTLEAEGEREVTATGQEDVKTQATGKITIYKTTPGQERLIKNTRFATEDGQVFRITESAVVPGATDETPGQVTADVFADEPGEEYNLSAGTRFSVPGFQESDLTELYNSVYAVNPADFTGGYEGPRFIIDENQLQAATESLQNELGQALRDRVDSERPAGFTLFPSAITFVHRDLPSEEIGDGKVKLKRKVVLQVPIFKNEDFASAIASASIPGYEGEPVRIDDVSALNFEYATTTGDIAAAESISFRLTGNPTLVWVFDSEQLKQDLSGGAQTALNTVLGGYPAIERATATIRPFWQRSFPEDPEDITIVESVGAEN